MKPINDARAAGDHDGHHRPPGTEQETLINAPAVKLLPRDESRFERVWPA
jgi:hypothetical protein